MREYSEVNEVALLFVHNKVAAEHDDVGEASAPHLKNKNETLGL